MLEQVPASQAARLCDAALAAWAPTTVEWYSKSLAEWQRFAASREGRWDCPPACVAVCRLAAGVMLGAIKHQGHVVWRGGCCGCLGGEFPTGFPAGVAGSKGVCGDAGQACLGLCNRTP